MKLRQLDGQDDELSAQDFEGGENIFACPFASPDCHEAVEIAIRVVALLDTRNASLAVESSETEADDYDGSVSISEWLQRKSH